MKKTSVSIESSETVKEQQFFRQCGRFLAKTVALPEYWEIEIPDGSGNDAGTRKRVNQYLRILKNPKRIGEVVMFLNIKLWTQLRPFPSQYQREIAKAFVSALDVGRVEALINKRLGTKIQS